MYKLIGQQTKAKENNRKRLIFNRHRIYIIFYKSVIQIIKLQSIT